MSTFRRGNRLKNAKYLRTKRSFGLVVVLLLLVLVATFVTSLLFLVGNERTANSNYSEEVRVQQMALSGVQTTIADLRMEMQAGSSITTTASGSQILLPISSASMKIMPISNAISVSDHLRSSAPFTPSQVFDSSNYPGVLPISRASNSSTTNVSLNGRTIPYPAFWDRAYLYDTSMDASLKPPAPSWIYIQRAGVSTNALTWSPTFKDKTDSNSAYILGRYAYQLYDAGGLIDLNVAGAPPGLTAAQARALEGTLAGIDLIDLTNSSGFTETSLTDLIAFRNSGITGDYVTSITNFPTATNGYMTTMPGNNRFLSRGDLIRFAQKEGFTGALPYLTCFSRDVNVPSWEPRYDASASYPYLSSATNDTATNRFFAGVTTASSESQTYYTLSGTQMTTNLATGQPRIWKRFPLSRISWLQQVQSGNTSFTADVQSAFGLAWNSSTGRWVYSLAGSTATPDTTIRTLAQIPAGTAPNFFELIKAGILSGSLAHPMSSTQLASFSPKLQTYSNEVGGVTGASPLQDPNLDYQVMKIGACIIDQYTSNATPTAIDFDYAPLMPAAWKLAWRVPATGIKDLPYLYLLGQYATLATGGASTLTQQGWLVFELWNPHQQNPNAAAAPAGVLISSGNASTAIGNRPLANSGGPVITGGFTTDSENTSTVGLTFTSPGLSPTGRTINFNPANLSNYRSGPAMFKSADTIAGDAEAAMPTTQKGFYLGSQTIAPPVATKSLTGSTSYFDVYYFGYGSTDNATISSSPYGSDGVPIQLQAKASTISVPYQVVTPHPFSGNYWGMEKWGKYPQQNANYGPNVPLTQSVAFESHALSASDPRTTRGGWTEVAPREENSETVLSYGDGLYQTNSIVTADADGMTRANDVNAATPPNATGGSAERPIILSRPFHTPADMGYAFRDQEWKTVNFSSTNSADAGLLDIFSVYDDPPVTAGHINLNSAPQPVIKAVISGSTKNEIQGTTFSASDADTIASAFTNWTEATPMYSRAELSAFASTNTINGVITNNRKFEREGAIRALSGVGQTRTIILLLDIVVQTGQYSPTAASLSDFSVKSQAHYWAHIAMDRYTGEVVDLQIEPVYE